MIMIAVCSIGRGDEITSCVREGISWVRQDGTQVRDADFTPIHHCRNKECRIQNCVRDFLILFPGRKNRQDSPSWIPIASATAIRMMALHLKWLKQVFPGGSRMLFPPRSNRRSAGRRLYAPPSNPSAGMSCESFRALLRQAIHECCGVSPSLAAHYGTHSPRLGAMELLRKHGVSKELRQQMGQWMSEKVALSYLQMSPGAQFDILQSI